MNLVHSIREGLRDLRAHQFRSILTLLGVVLGVASLVVMQALTEGMARGMRESLESTGEPNKVRIYRDSPPAEQQQLADTSPGLTYLDVLGIQEHAPKAIRVVPGITRRVTATYNNRRDGTMLIGTEEGILEADRHDYPAGRFLRGIDMDRSARVCVLGARVADRLFSPEPLTAPGKTIRIENVPFLVIGVLPRYLTLDQQRALETGQAAAQEQRRKERGQRTSTWGWDPYGHRHDMIYIPLTTLQVWFKKSPTDEQVLGDDMPISEIQVEAASASDVPELIEQIRQVLLRNHRGIEDFRLEERSEDLARIDQEVSSTRTAGSLVAGLGLIVGGIGIMNIMLAGIVERVREIGIRRAVGAGALDIFMQTLMEALLLSAAGGVLGVALAVGVVVLLDDVAKIPNTPILTTSGALTGLFFALVTGVAAGMYPSWQAAGLQPVEAMRRS